MQHEYLSNATVHVDPMGSSGEEYHQRAQDNHQEDETIHHTHYGDDRPGREDRTYREAHPFPRNSTHTVMISRRPPAGQTLAPAQSCSPHPLDIMVIYAMYQSK